ncbi:hypothetical protein [Ascidiaceihabitans sp.]|uniref:hypothetical protein n=1 Tax=Ascidiaceihabitans sp. TaxID=1872644 RepID=UPI00329A2BE9
MPKMTLYMQTENGTLNDAAQVAAFCATLPKDFAVTKYGVSENPREMDAFKGFDDAAWLNWTQQDPSSLSLKMKKYTLDYRAPAAGFGSWMLLRPSARDFAAQIKAMDTAWGQAIPDADAFTYSYCGYTSHAQSPSHGQADSEYVNRFKLPVHFPVYHARTGEYLYDASEDMSALGPGKLDLLPGLTWRIAMGEPLFEKFNISPDEISRVCLSTKETTAASGARLWTFQTRNDPLAWRESYDMQLKLNRPDVFFDIAPLRSRFADPVQISDSGKGDALATAFRAALIDLYPQSATKEIKA